ncbi:MAG: DUF5678 domain-containing protein [Candidatus Aerophobetes bacterium]|nr:DUF5678 domain-containing protein [Candidatus Aerophobetes bacterium]
MAKEEDKKWRNGWTHKDFKKYGGKYIAIKDKHVVASAKNLEELEQRLDAMKVGKVIIEFIEDPSVVVIYRPILEVEIRGIEEKWYRFIVDSGADISVAPRYICDRLNLTWYKGEQVEMRDGSD